MKLETFFEIFDLFADAPDAVARMRSLILQLAMQGNLSEPHENDRPIKDLLRKIKEERAALGLKDSAESESFGVDAGTLNEIPERWTWIRFGHLARHNAGKTLDKGRNSGELRDYITTSNLYWGFFQLNDVRQMPIQADELERCTATRGDLLIVEGGEAGRAAVWSHDYDICFQNHIHRARFFAEIDPYFIQRYFEKLNASGEIANFRKGVAISNMSGKALASIPIPLPPLAEQKRIVAKVDELMALCDRLEAQQQERETRHAALARASLARFADAPTPANLGFLFHPSYAIPPADLRKSILTLAVQGKLVPQDPNDEPAVVLLARISRKKGSTDDSPSPNEDFSAPFEIPSNWAWARATETTRGISDFGKKIKTKDVAESGRFPVVDQGKQFIRGYSDDEDKVIHVDTPIVVFGDHTRETKLIDFDFIVGADGVKLMQPIEIDPRYYLYALRWLPLDDRGYGRHFKLLRSANIPIPPLAEQRRIVAKVEQLMALVDALEQQLAASRATAANLLTSLVSELTSAPLTANT